jgi:hypothetical protein
MQLTARLAAFRLSRVAPPLHAGGYGPADIPRTMQGAGASGKCVQMIAGTVQGRRLGGRRLKVKLCNSELRQTWGLWIEAQGARLCVLRSLGLGPFMIDTGVLGLTGVQGARLCIPLYDLRAWASLCQTLICWDRPGRREIDCAPPCAWVTRFVESLMATQGGRLCVG